jgi:putative ATP-binding cassette transporter
MSDVLTFFNRLSDTPSGIRVERTADAPGIDVEKLSLYLDNGDPILQDVSFHLRPGDRLMLTGESGSGKSSLLWAIYGLWKFRGEGTARLPPDGDALYASQVAYFPAQLTLRGILAYPKPAEDFSDDDMHEALNAIGMPELVPELDAPIDGKVWKNRLSGGQQQKIVIGRILLNRPRVLLVDEISSGLDEKTEFVLYNLLVQRLPQTIMVSISHRPKIAAMHTLLGNVANKRLMIEPIDKTLIPTPEKPKNQPPPRWLKLIRAVA